tara:strand:+ start:2510 stop:3121 length:612 start_codon:yes stop_codon:yes gene_type:complete
MWIFKIGGSWISNPNLIKLLRLLKDLKSEEDLILVFGGGIFADSVRKVYANINMTEKTGNFLALKSTEIFSHLVNQMFSHTCLISDPNDLSVKTEKLKIWMPSKTLKNEATFIKNWDSTSDSVAAWLHNRICSKGLIFIKSLTLKKKSYKLSYLKGKNVLDKNIDKYLLRNENIKIIGPNVISLLEKYKDFYQFSKQLNEVRL